ncbi:MAG: type VI secretion system baseplate subunit TssG [Thermoanaerobaculaceae bacterium]|nr:type VI secretion system baseplate subunit TssG [Thermoanaerobaculaceae bacterium]MDI9620317.1 type VI secretion system baseplate subunit TssG [Acidobacteriota bacterium]NLH11420.1 type VI secretion system baseplate subunit TssG [Holophagae bacterium]HPW55792.1 type VI secretion system baseplate subunit TssG [Thermoanaerobaculaceae bacterium]
MSVTGHQFDFFQLVYLLERWLDRRAPVGGPGPIDDEGVRFRPDASLAFSPADVMRVEKADADERRPGSSWDYRVVVSFMGLYGVAAPSPVYFSELIGFEDVDPDPLVDFLDLFNHRLISLYYRAWLRYRYPYRFEVGGADQLSGFLLAFLGLCDPVSRQGLGVDAFRLLKYIGLLSLRSKPPEALQRVLTDYLGGFPVAVRELVLRWVDIEPANRNRLGLGASTLGRDLLVGTRLPDRMGRVRVVVGPLGLDQFLKLLPDRTLFGEVCSLIELQTFKRFAYDVELRLHGSAVPTLQVGGPAAVRLGWTSFLCSAPGRDEDGVVWLQPARRSQSREVRA